MVSDTCSLTGAERGDAGISIVLRKVDAIFLVNTRPLGEGLSS